MSEHVSKLRQCTTRKIPILLREGRTQDQAVAEAFSVCNKEIREAAARKAAKTRARN